MRHAPGEFQVLGDIDLHHSRTETRTKRLLLCILVVFYNTQFNFFVPASSWPPQGHPSFQRALESAQRARRRVYDRNMTPPPDASSRCLLHDSSSTMSPPWCLLYDSSSTIPPPCSPLTFTIPPRASPGHQVRKNNFTLSGLEKRLQKVSPKVQKWSPKGIPNRWKVDTKPVLDFVLKNVPQHRENGCHHGAPNGVKSDQKRILLEKCRHAFGSSRLDPIACRASPARSQNQEKTC